MNNGLIGRMQCNECMHALQNIFTYLRRYFVFGGSQYRRGGDTCWKSGKR